MLLISVVLYLVLTVAVGFWVARRVHSTSDYMLAGRSLPLVLTSSAMFATWFGSETVFGASAEFLEGGLYAVIEDPFGAVLCLLLFGFFYARKLYQLNLLTMGDFFRVKFGPRTELVASIFLAFPYIGYIAAQLVAMGLILNVVTGMEVWHGVVISSAVVTLYTFVGGMWAISITDFVQTIIIIVGLVILAINLGIKAGGVEHILSSVPPERFKFLPNPDFKEVAAYIAAWAVLGLGSIPSQDVFQRTMSSRSATVAVRSCIIAAIMYLTIAMIPLFISLCTQLLYPESAGDDPQLSLPRMVIDHTSLPIQILFFGSLLSAIMSTTSAAILAPASVFSENLIKPLMKGKLRDNNLLSITRAAVVLFSILATIMACMRSNIYELVGESSILSLVSLFVPLTMGLYWKRGGQIGALSSMISGISAWLLFEYLETDWPSLIPATIISFVAFLVGSLIFDKQSNGENRTHATQ